jgi:uncharacterized protein with von Willebrand factor type A (vWA) domain
MNALTVDDLPEGAGGRLAENVMHFGRVLRAAGLPVGPGAVIAAVRAVEAVGLANRTDFYWALHAVFVNRRSQRELFDQAFHIFWRNPQILERMLSLMLPSIDTGDGDGEDKAEKQVSPRLAEAFAAGKQEAAQRREAEEEIELDAAMTWSDEERLRKKDFRRCPTRRSRWPAARSAACACRSSSCRRGASGPTGSARGPTCGRRSRRRSRPAATSSRSSSASGARATRRWSCCATSPARWSAIRACYCTSCTR